MKIQFFICRILLRLIAIVIITFITPLIAFHFDLSNNLHFNLPNKLKLLAKSGESYTVELPESFNFQAGQESTLSMSSMGTTLDQIECTWDFGDESPTATTTFDDMGMIDHTYEENGTFIITLTCINEKDETATDTSIAYVGREASEDAYRQAQEAQDTVNSEDPEGQATAQNDNNSQTDQKKFFETFSSKKTIIIIGTFLFIVIAGLAPVFMLIRKGKI
jgi:hypothetical protein